VTSELFTPQHGAVLKFAIAASATALLVWGGLLRRAGHDDRFRGLRDGLLLALGILGALGWSNFLQLSYGGGFGHPLDTYHYYIGAKYFDELGYTRLYACTTVADAESGLREQAQDRWIRNLETYERESARVILADPDRCTRHFSAERWQDFKTDIGWFRARIPEPLWRGGLADHGYNPSPAWGAIANTLIRSGPVTDARLISLLLLDPVLLVLLWAFCWRAFGWRATCVALVFWGTNLPGEYQWTGGAFLRQLWFASLGIGLACLRLRWMLAAGFFLGISALVRVFPVMTIVAIGLAAVLAMWRERRIRVSPEHRRLALGLALAAAVLVPLSFANAGGARAWLDFAKNIGHHSDTPFVTNVGAKSLLAFDHETRHAQLERESQQPARAWVQARKQTLASRRGLFAALAVAYVLLLARAVDRREDWVAAALGTGAVIVFATMSNYYFAVLVPFGLLWLRREAVGTALCALSAVTLWIGWSFSQYDEIYAWVSLATLVFVLGATAALAFGRSGERTPDSPVNSDPAPPSG
jgi:hypothetical protein